MQNSTEQACLKIHPRSSSAIYGTATWNTQTVCGRILMAVALDTPAEVRAIVCSTLHSGSQLLSHTEAGRREETAEGVAKTERWEQKHPMSCFNLCAFPIPSCSRSQCRPQHNQDSPEGHILCCLWVALPPRISVGLCQAENCGGLVVLCQARASKILPWPLLGL